MNPSGDVSILQDVTEAVLEQLLGGTSEIQQLVIARAISGLRIE